VQSLDKAVELAGGYAKYQRLETLSCDFEETVYDSSGPVRISGRRIFRLHDDAGLRIWEEAMTPEGTRITVVTSSGSWSSLNGTPVPADGSALAAELFWMAGPQRIKEAGARLTPLPIGRLLGRKVDRFQVEAPALFPGADGLILCLHPETAQMDGAAFGDQEVYFHEFETTKGFLVVPSLRAHTRGGKRARLVRLSHLVVNDYVDDAIFQIPQGVHP
jgi:hypothetical protein